MIAKEEYKEEMITLLMSIDFQIESIITRWLNILNGEG
jgi:hypothetical protein